MQAMRNGQHPRLDQRPPSRQSLRTGNGPVDDVRPRRRRRVHVRSPPPTGECGSLRNKQRKFVFYLSESSSGLLLPPYVFNGFMAHLTFREVDGQAQQPHARGGGGGVGASSPANPLNPHQAIPSKLLLTTRHFSSFPTGRDPVIISIGLAICNMHVLCNEGVPGTTSACNIYI